jgi:signal transduction histidine kinase
MRFSLLFFTNIISFLNIVFLAIIYFSKSRLENKENKIYKKLVVANIVGLVINVLCEICSALELSSLNMIVTKLLLVYFMFWILQFILYVLEISNIKKHNYNLFSNIVLLISTFVVFALPYNAYINQTDRVYYTYGLDTKYTYGFSIACILFITLVIVMRHKTVSQKKAIPIYLLIVLFTISGLIQFFRPEFTIIVQAESFICLVMYFTIENPDMKMLNEVYKNKELMEQGYEDKYNFLFEMTQEARGPLININNLSNALRMEDDQQKVKDGLLTLNNMVRQLDFSVNNILNISSLDISKVKIVDNKYDLEKMCHDLEVRVKQDIKPDVTFNLTIPKQIPVLYGDYMKIRQILYSLLLNACKNTENGTINMKVNLIEKYDVARVIFNISDTGTGMSIDKINEILSATGSLDQNELENLEKKEFNVTTCQKVAKIMGGNLMIKSNIGEGTEVVLTIDQRVYHEKDTSVLNKYESMIANYRKVLIVSQNKDKLAIIKKKFAESNITYSSFYYGMDAVDRLKSGKKFDFILVEDEMKEMTGFMTFKEMQKLNDFKTPVIIMLNEDKDHIKDHYLDDGFSDYLLLDNLESELDRIIEKY